MLASAERDQDDLIREEELLQFLYQAPVGIIQFEVDGRIGLSNSKVAQLLMPLMLDRGSENLFELLEGSLPDLRSAVLGFERGRGTVFENRRVHLGSLVPGKDPVWLSLTVVKVSPGRFMAVFADISAQVAQERRVRQADAWFTAILRGADDYMFCTVDGLGRVTEWNASGERLTGWTAGEIVGRPFSALYLPDDGLGDMMADRLQRASRDGWDLDEGWRVRRDGTRFYGNCMVSVMEATPPRKSFLLVMRDVTERRHAADELKRLATTDHLTGVTNRARFFELAEDEIELARRNDRPLSLVMMDADRFKQVNDVHGHLIGDKVLRQLADTCAAEVRGVDVLARLGGEEFVILMPACDAFMARAIAERLRRAVSARDLETGTGPLRVTASFGVAELLSSDGGVEDLLRRADKALYAAKEAGRDRVVVG